MQVVDRTTFEPMIARSPQRTYAASAFASLAIGFATAALGLIAATRRPSRSAGANAAFSLICGGLALGLRRSARPVPTVGSQQPTALADLNDAGSLDYSIIIPVYNRPAEMRTLLNCLSDIGKASLHLGNGEIIVIDDGSTDDTLAVVQDLAPRMSIPTRVISKRNGGVSSGRNAGFAAARGEIGIVIDSDCIPEATWLESMLSAVRSDRRLLVFARLRRGKRPVYPLENLPDSKGFVGASFAMDRRSYLELGGCYERYGASHDDRDLVLTALAHGYDVAHAIDGWIVHPLRRETFRSMWHVGLNSRFGNLLAMRHGAYAARDTQPTPYYFLGIGSNYGSSIALVVSGVNVALAAYQFISDPPSRGRVLKGVGTATFALASAYIVCLGTLGVLTRAPIRDLPKYIATLGTFQLATMIGRARGTIDYGIFLL